MNTFDLFNEGKLVLPDKIVEFAAIPWSIHPSFNGVALKHIIRGEETHGQFSYHLVRLTPNCEIGLHTHQAQLETHEVISGGGVCLNDNALLNYYPGIISIFPKGIPHKITAGSEGLYLFAKFLPALC